MPKAWRAPQYKPCAEEAPALQETSTNAVIAPVVVETAMWALAGFLVIAVAGATRKGARRK